MNESPETEELTIYLAEMKDGTFTIMFDCPDCFCIIKRIGICHRCPEYMDYVNEEELQEHKESMELLGHIYQLYC